MLVFVGVFPKMVVILMVMNSHPMGSESPAKDVVNIHQQDWRNSITWNPGPKTSTNENGNDFSIG